MSKHCIIPVFVPHLGCPHACIFCNQRKITNATTNISVDQVQSTVEKYLGYFYPNSLIEIAFYGGSFTAIDIDLQNSLLKMASDYKRKGTINEIRISTRPDAINKEILENLKQFQVDTIELGVQSLDDRVLKASGRGHTPGQVYKAVALIKSYGFKLGLQMMIGLPEDNLNKSYKTALEFINLGPDCVRIYPTLVIKSTYLEKLAKQGKYKPLSLDEAVRISRSILILFYLNNINVIRVGLQVTDNIQLGKDVVSGPFHPAFRQLVEADIYRSILDYYLDENKFDTQNQILEIYSTKKAISNISGQKSSNIKYLINKYGFKKIGVYETHIRFDRIVVKINNHEEEINLNTMMKLQLQGDSLINKNRIKTSVNCEDSY